MGRIAYIRNSSDNLVSFVLYADEVAASMSGVTRVQVEVDDAGGTVLDSQTAALAMSWGTLIDGAHPVTFKGAAAGLSPGVYRDCLVRIFDASSTDGIVWPEPLTLVVED